MKRLITTSRCCIDCKGNTAKPSSLLKKPFNLVISTPQVKGEDYDLSQISGLEKSTLEYIEVKANSFYNLGLIYGLKGELDSAEESFKNALQVKPNWSEAHSNLGKVYELKNDFTQALHHFEAAVRNSPQKAIYHYNLGVIYLKSGDKEMALRSLQMATTLEPNFKPAKEVLRQLKRKN